MTVYALRMVTGIRPENKKAKVGRYGRDRVTEKMRGPSFFLFCPSLYHIQVFVLQGEKSRQLIAAILI